MDGTPKLSPIQVCELREMFHAGIRRKVIASRFDLALSSVYRIASMESYKAVKTTPSPNLHRCHRCGCPV